MADGSRHGDWEYEYSNTETEVHLITLDLSLSAKQDSWPNSLLDSGDAKAVRNDMGLRAKDTQHDENTDNDEQAMGSDDQGDNSSDGDNIGAGMPLQANESLGRLARDEAVAKDIQILDLHSAEPVIAYGGMVLTGSWTDNIGTELLFAEHCDGNSSNGNNNAGAATTTTTATTATPSGTGLTISLPFARQLPHNVDLLGASTARIACTATELRRRQDRANADDIKKARKRLGFSIPVTGGATEQRHKQAAFLENLMAIKHRRGEEDVVTVQATETKHNKVLGDRGENRLRRRKQAQVDRYQKRLKKQHEEGDAAVVAPGAAAAEAELPG